MVYSVKRFWLIQENEASVFFTVHVFVYFIDDIY